MTGTQSNSFHLSPAEAKQGPPRGVPLRRRDAGGHGRRRARLPRGRRHEPRLGDVRDDRARDADAVRRRRAPPLRLEPLLVRLPRARPLAPDRPRLPLLAGLRAQRRRRPAAAADREGDRARRARSRDRLHAAAHDALHAGRERRHLDARRRRGQCRRRLRRHRREDVRGQGPLGERRRAAADELRLLVPAAQERAGLQRVRRPERLRAGLRPRRRGGRLLRAAAPLLEPRAPRARADRSTSARTGSSRSRSAGSTTRRPTRASSARRCRPRSGASTARTARTRPSR